MADPQVRVLGEVAVHAGGRDSVVGARRERSVLAVLVAAGDAPVPAAALVDALWGEQAPASAAASLQVAVSRLRGLLDPARTARDGTGPLTSGPAGYRLRLPDDAVDVRRAECLAQAALAPGLAAEDRVAACEAALAVWAEPYPGAQHLPGVAEEVTRLQALHLDVVEARAQALLDCGRHEVVAGVLAPVATQHPFRERLWALLALAQYRCDRQADALATLRTLRTALADELGVDPSAAVQALEVDVLSQASHLAATVRPSVPVAAAPRAAGSSATTDEPTPPGTPPLARVPAPRGPVVTEGRETALQAVDDAVGRLRAGAGGVLVLSGEPGIGKSVLAEELAARAEASGARVLWGRCHEADVAPAYWPWLPVLREVVGPDAPAELAALVGHATAPAPASGAGAEDLRTYDAAATALRGASTSAPLVVVLEDVHWADTSSLRLLAYVAEALRDDPVLLAVTRRTVDAPRTPALATALAALARIGAVRVPLQGLDPAGVTRLLHHVVASAPPELADTVAARTDGNPFFVLELARLLAGPGGPGGPGAGAAAGVGSVEPHQGEQVGAPSVLEVPDGVRDVLRLRVQRLGEPVQRVLRAASVAGREIDPSLVATVLAGSAGAAGADLEGTLDRLDEAVEAGVVLEETGRYRFSHALVRETVYGDLAPSRRLRLHATVAAALEERLAGDPELLSDVAHHYRVAAAARPDLVDTAVARTREAAAVASARAAREEAGALLAAALEVCRLHPSPDPLARHGLLVEHAVAQMHLGDIAGARASVEAAVELARGLDRWDLVAEALTTSNDAGVWHWREFGQHDPVAIATMQACAERLADGPLLARLLAALQMEHTYAWQSEEADQVGERALALARASGDTDLVLECLRLRILSLWGPGTAEHRLALVREMLSLSGRDGDVVHARFQQACTLHQTGRPVEADEAMARCLDTARRLRHTSTDVPLAWWLFMRAYERGDADAPDLAHAALALHRRTTVVGLTELSGMVALRLAPDGADVPPDVVADARGHGNPAHRATVAQALAAAGRCEEAVDLLGAPVPEGSRDYARLAGDCLRVDTLATAGRVDLLPAALARIAPWASEVTAYGSVDSLGSVQYFLGRAHEALGDLAAARTAYAAAVERNRQIGNVPWGRRAQARLDALAAPAEEVPQARGKRTASTS